MWRAAIKKGAWSFHFYFNCSLCLQRFPLIKRLVIKSLTLTLLTRIVRRTYGGTTAITNELFFYFINFLILYTFYFELAGRCLLASRSLATRVSNFSSVIQQIIYETNGFVAHSSGYSPHVCVGMCSSASRSLVKAYHDRTHLAHCRHPSCDPGTA